MSRVHFLPYQFPGLFLHPIQLSFPGCSPLPPSVSPFLSPCLTSFPLLLFISLSTPLCLPSFSLYPLFSPYLSSLHSFPSLPSSRLCLPPSFLHISFLRSSFVPPSLLLLPPFLSRPSSSSPAFLRSSFVPPTFLHSSLVSPPLLLLSSVPLSSLLLSPLTSYLSLVRGKAGLAWVDRWVLGLNKISKTCDILFHMHGNGAPSAW